MLKQRFSAALDKVSVRRAFKRMFKKKPSSTKDASNSEAKSEDAQSVEPTEKTADAALVRSSSGKSTVRSKSSAPPADAAQEGNQESKVVPAEAGRASEEIAPGKMRMSESPSENPMPQLPTITVGEDLEPIDLSPRKDSGHLPRSDDSLDYHDQGKQVIQT
ncbi:hypothetical protein AMATHDRAFT_5400 [Amanita thiersii Skay4041]|uniref:Uncharacterized protein n=1 Tax=Amanita thiersii Skay4041 TaxID=703135 RepID=A0A2A9NMH0_9AGAR|nr:hypothetical protein AMATHDRAFT_5400 [Amanita thiersii Skay4041]